jgi:hypothetical protein
MDSPEAKGSEVSTNGLEVYEPWCYTIIVFLDVIHRPVFFKHTTFWRLDSFSVLRWYPFSWAQARELVPISGHQHQCKRGYINQA